MHQVVFQQFGKPIADFSNLANCLSSSSRHLLLMFKLAHPNNNTGCKAVRIKTVLQCDIV